MGWSEIIIHLFSNDLDEDSLSSSAVELPIENLLPWSEVELPVRDGHDDFSSHHLPLQMRIGIILADIVTILFNRLMGSKLLKPNLKVMMKSGFVIIDED